MLFEVTPTGRVPIVGVDLYCDSCGSPRAETRVWATTVVTRYIDRLLPDLLEGRIEPGGVFDRVTTIDGVPDGYRAMNEGESIKVMIEF